MRIELTRDLDRCRELRRRVFIDEQGVPASEEWDGLDEEALHWLCWKGYTPIGTARAFIKGNTAKIGRVCVLAEARGTGAGLDLMRAVLNDLREKHVTRATLSSQSYAIPFYEKLGFVAHGSEYSDAGIPHRDMVLELW